MKNQQKPKRSHPKWRIIKLVLVCLAVLFLFDAAVYEPRHPVLRAYQVNIPGLPSRLDGFKVVQLSDIHRRRITPDIAIKRAVAIANSTHPDAAVLTGDYISRKYGDIKPCFDMLSHLKTRYGIFAVLGNHDHWLDADAVSSSIRKHGIVLLNNDNVRLSNGLYIAGIDDLISGNPKPGATVKGIPHNEPIIMLAHNPRTVDGFEGRRGLFLCGHTHGGQVNFPPIPRNKLPFSIDPYYVAGLYPHGKILVYVNKGIGMVNPALRFQCRPEVTLFVLHSIKSDKNESWSLIDK